MSFKSMVAADNAKVFLNVGEFAEGRTVIYENVRYENIPAVLAGVGERGRRALADDHAEGLYQAAAVLRCAVSDLGGAVPQRGRRIQVSDGGGPPQEFRVASSACGMGMLRVELEAVGD